MIWIGDLDISLSLGFSFVCMAGYELAFRIWFCIYSRSWLFLDCIELV